MKTKTPSKLFLLLSFAGSLTLVMAGTAIVFTTTPNPLWIICGSIMAFCGWALSLAITDVNLNTIMMGAGGYLFLAVGSMFMLSTFTTWAIALLVLSICTFLVIPVLATGKN